ncbi:hypothetical protein B0H12DRAFT_1103043 [Mycena haematopus]|nr:hypothetical protein B0H12DRAFT_1103043 [Mycena haematopus]
MQLTENGSVACCAPYSMSRQSRCSTRGRAVKRKGFFFFRVVLRVMATVQRQTKT